MAPLKRRVFVTLIMVTGFLYFLYATYTSAFDTSSYRFFSLNKVFENASHSSSSPLMKEKKNLSSVYITFDNISNKSSKSTFNLFKSPKNKSEERKELSNILNVVPVLSSQNNNVSSQSAIEGKSSVIQRIPPKVENVAIDYIIQGIPSRNVYISGFKVPNVELCPDFGINLKIIILITSAPIHSEARKAIRQTWGHFQMRSDIAIGFVLGRSSIDFESKIKNESSLYGDIILANFKDSYNNLTLKTLSILEWVNNYCNKVKYVLKTDDDMFINIPKLLDFVGKHWKDEKKIFGRLAKKWKPMRNKDSKYYVSVQQYKDPMFPDFTTGPAYLLTSDVIQDLYSTALDTTYLKLEDVFTTGIVAQKRNVKRIHVAEFLNRRPTLTSCNIQKAISIHMVKPYEQYDLWKRLFDSRTKC